MKNGYSSRVAGLDSIRFVAAAWVMFAHGARAPLADAPTRMDEGWRALAALNNGLFNDVAAVMVFFIVSGFVIHAANAGRDRLDIAGHYARRLTRIAPPALIAHGLCLALGPAFLDRFSDILWSLYCEIAYYAIYPLLFPYIRRFGAARVAMASIPVAAISILTTAGAPYHSQLDIANLVAIGLPCWLAGCALAERRTQADIGGAIWRWRAAALALSVVLKLPVTHGPVHVGYPASHWIFALFAFFWLAREMDHFARRAPPAWSETLGRMSYSMYLVHTPVIVLFALSESANAPLRGLFGAGLAGWTIHWLAMLATLAVMTQLFCILVEAPCHRLAQRLGAILMASRSFGPGNARLSS